MNTTQPWVPGANALWRFAQVPDPPVPFPRTDENELERLKNRLLREALQRLVTTALTAPIRRAANEAAALAWLEPYPLLVFPVLFEEKVRNAMRRAQKQQWIQARSADLFAVAS